MATARVPGAAPAVAVAAVLLAASPTPAGAVRTLAAAAHAADPVDPLVAALSLVAWCLLAWVGAVALGVWAAAGKGRLSDPAAAVVTRIAPASVRRVVAVSLGISVAAAVATASPALATGSDDHPPGPVVTSLDWPSAVASPALDWNPASPVSVVHPEHPTAPGTAVVVRPGDSLWAVAAQHLPAGAAAAVIAHSWPTWWAANREAIGADPGLIHPGLVLTPPDNS